MNSAGEKKQFCMILCTNFQMGDFLRLRVNLRLIWLLKDKAFLALRKFEPSPFYNRLDAKY